MEIEIVEKALPCVLGEGPHWSVTENVLYYVDIPKGRVLRYDPRNGGSCFYVDVYGHDPVSFVVPCLDRPKEFMIGRGRDLCRLHWDFDQEPRKQDRSCKSDHWVVVMENVDRQLFNNRFNDGKCDPLGRLFAGTMGNEKSPGTGDIKRHQGTFYFCRQSPDDDKKALVESRFTDIDISNGLEWSLDGQVMYYIDTLTSKVEAFDFDASNGGLSNRQTIFDLRSTIQTTDKKPVNPDGMTIDTRGHLWVAVFGRSQVLEIDPQSRKCLSTISFEGLADNITSCAFGGPELRDLYVTSAEQVLPDGSRKGGQLFVVRHTGAQGLPARSFDPAAR